MIGVNGRVKNNPVPINIFLVEDNPADVLLTVEALRESNVSHDLNVVNNGADALAYVKRQGKYADSLRPDIILLDINIPKKDGFEVLKEIKEDPNLKRIPVIILTTSSSKQDISRAYDLHASCYIVKPIELDDFFTIIKKIEDFWFTVVRLP